MGEPVTLLEDALQFSALRRFDLIAPEAVVAWASLAVGDGSDSPALLTLACEYPGAETRAIDASLAAYLVESGVNPPDPLQSAMLVCGEVAARIRAGDLEPGAGGQRIVSLTRYAQDDSRLFGMRSLVDDWENTWPASSAILEEIRTEAAHLAELREEILRSLTSDVSQAALGSNG